MEGQEWAAGAHGPSIMSGSLAGVTLPYIIAGVIGLAVALYALLRHRGLGGSYLALGSVLILAMGLHRAFG